jgi:ABC-type lipoprotein export system ATPase subunit
MERAAGPDPLTPALRARDLRRRFEGPAGEVLAGIDLDLWTGELVALTGPSGVGKTSLLQVLAGVAAPDGGTVLAAGRPVVPAPAAESARRRGDAVSLVPQSHGLLPELAVEDNVALPLLVRGDTGLAAARRRAREELAQVRCDHLAAQPARELSAGERARIAVARGLAAGVPVLLCDEPTSNLDAESRAVLVERLERAARDEGRAVLAASHDPALVAAAGRELRLAGGTLAAAAGAAPTAASRAVPAPPGEGRCRLPRLAWILTRGFRSRLAAAAVTVAVAVALAVAALGLLQGSEEAVAGPLLGALPEGFVRVSPRVLSLGVVELSLERFQGGLLDAAAVERLAAIPAVRELYPQAMSRFPAQVSASLLGRGFRTDVALEGLSARWLADDVDPERFRFRPEEPQAPIPVVLSDSLLALYNAGFAPSHGLPRLGRDSVLGLELAGLLGGSSFADAPGPPIPVTLRVIGFSPRVSPLTLAVPLEAVQHFNRLFAERASADPAQRVAHTGLASVVLVVGDLERLGEVSAQVEAMGFTVDQGDGLAPRLGRALRLLSAQARVLALVLLGLLVVVLALLLSALLVVRRRYLDLLQLLGAAPSRLLLLLACEVLAVAVLGVVGGAIGGYLLGEWLGGALEGLAAEALGVPIDALFAPPWELLGPALALLPPMVLLLSLPTTAAWLRRSLAVRLEG